MANILLAENLEGGGAEEEVEEAAAAGGDEDVWPPWSDLLPDVLNLIVSRLPPPETSCFAAVCKAWRAVVPPVYSHHASLPLLMHFRRSADARTNKCCLFSPWMRRTFSVDIPLLSSPHLFVEHVKDGWLVVLDRGPSSLAFALNPFTGSSFHLPRNPNLSSYIKSVCLSGIPDSSYDWMAFIVGYLGPSKVLLQWCAHGDEEWAFEIYQNPVQFVPSHCNPVCLDDGLFYCLGEEGNLGVFDPYKESWTVYKVSLPFVLDRRQDYSFLAECNGDLFAVFTARMVEAAPLNVFMMDWSTMSWIEIDDFEGGTLFLSAHGALMTTTTTSDMSLIDVNKVFYPMIHGDTGQVISATVTSSQDHVFIVPNPGEVTRHEKNKKKKSPFPNFERRSYNTTTSPVDDDRETSACRNSCNHLDEPVFYSMDDREIHPSRDFYLSNECSLAAWVVPNFN